MTRNKSKLDTSTLNCILCSSVIPSKPNASRQLSAVTLVPVTYFMRLLKGWVKQEPGVDSSSLVDSPYFRFCLCCTNKIDTVQAIYSELETLQTKLALLKHEFEEEIIRSDRNNAAPPWNRSTTLRHRIIREFGLDTRPFAVVDTAGLSEVSSEINMPRNADYDDEDTFEPANLEPDETPLFRLPEQTTIQTIPLKKCTIQLGTRVTAPAPVSSTSRTLRYKVRSHCPEDMEFHEKCPVPGCTSNATFKNLSKYRRHMSCHEKSNSSLPQRNLGFPKRCPLPTCTNPTVYRNNQRLQRHMKSHALAKIRKASNPMLTEAESLTYPAKCPRPGCTSTVEYENIKRLTRHLRRSHLEENRHRLTPEEIESQLNKCIYPTKCPIVDCENELQFGTRDELKCHFRARHHILRTSRKLVNPLYLEIQDFVYPAKCPRDGCRSQKFFDSRDTLTTHLKRVHDPKKISRSRIREEVDNPEPQSCAVCSLIFFTKVSLRHHVRIHEKPVINVTCKDCGAGFKTANGLKDHRTANHEPSFVPLLCSQCPKTFKTKVGLQMHMKRHEGHKNYFCRVCPKGFLYRHLLMDHERFVHWQELGLEQIKCQICGKIYNQNRTLQIHMKSHTGSQRFACSECNYKTTQRNDLREHLATVHQPDFPFPCNLCDKKFKLERRLRQHLLEHDPEGKTACEFCGKRYMTPRSLRIHREKKHEAEFPSRDFKNGFIAELALV